MMQALRTHTRSPVRLPLHWGLKGEEATRRRRRRYPIISALTIAALSVLPFIAYVAAVSNAARIGYRILQETQDIAALETDHQRLQAIASSLRAPDRIERQAITRLGLRAPGPGQIAALELPQPAARRPPLGGPGLWVRLGAYFSRHEAQAAPAPR